MSQKIKLAQSYITIRSLPIGKAAIGEMLSLGIVTIVVEGYAETYEGRLNDNGVITGLTKLIFERSITKSSDLEYEIVGQNRIKLLISNGSPNVQAQLVPSVAATAPPAVLSTYVADAKELRWVHFEVFRPTNLKYWVPRTEPDVYMVFGVLQEYTDYSYCCGTSKESLVKIGYLEKGAQDNPNKPDAILVEKLTDRYVIAEFKMISSDYSKNHKPTDVDVLVVWEDDETNRSLLPNKVVSLYETSKAAFDDLI